MSYRRLIDVQTTSCVYWDGKYFKLSTLCPQKGHTYLNKPAPEHCRIVQPKKSLGSQFDPRPSVVFPKIYFLERGWSHAFFSFWYYHKSHLSWKFHWNFSASRSEYVKSFFIDINYFHQFLEFFYISLLQRN